jgi:hypothetical protein
VTRRASVGSLARSARQAAQLASLALQTQAVLSENHAAFFATSWSLISLAADQSLAWFQHQGGDRAAAVEAPTGHPKDPTLFGRFMSQIWRWGSTTAPQHWRHEGAAGGPRFTSFRSATQHGPAK